MPGHAQCSPKPRGKRGPNGGWSPVSPSFRETECSVVLLHLGRCTPGPPGKYVPFENPLWGDWQVPETRRAAN